MGTPCLRLGSQESAPGCILTLERAFLGFVLVVVLLPVWSFKYFPTQDGPAHVLNGLILRDYGAPGNALHEYFRIVWEPIPNWTSFAILGALSRLFPPLMSEKLLISLYVIGFVASYRYFLGSFAEGRVWLVLPSILIVFNRCFWLGFYNFCLGSALYWLILGYLLRHLKDWKPRHALVLGLLFCLSYLTHLFGFLIAAGSCLWLAGTDARGRRALLSISVALLPAGLLAFRFLGDTHGAGLRVLGNHLLEWVQGTGQWRKVEANVLAFDQTLFAIDADGPVSFADSVIILFAAFFLAGFFGFNRERGASRRLWPLCLMGVGLAALSVLLPGDLGADQGGFLKARLLIFPPLIGLACCRESTARPLRYLLRAATLALLVFQLAGITSFVRASNDDLVEYTAGEPSIGKDRVLFVSTARENNRTVDPLRHAADYYCFQGNNINLNNHFAVTRYSPVQFRPGLHQGKGQINAYANRDLVDTIIFWDTPGADVPEGLEEFRMVFHSGRLKILQRNRDK